VIRNQWAILHTGSLPAGTGAWMELGLATFRIEGPHWVGGDEVIRDSGGALVDWLKDKKATAVVLRPDGFVYAASAPGQPLPPPPPGLTHASAPARSSRSEVELQHDRHRT